MIMNATVTRVNPQNLLVIEDDNGQEVQVNYRNPRRFSVGDHIRITYNGQMTMSIPPQISATNIQLINAPQVTPNEMRALVLQRGNNFLLVRNVNNGQILRVDYPFARYFCPGRQVIIQYDTLTFGMPPRVTATEILPVCVF